MNNIEKLIDIAKSCNAKFELRNIESNGEISEVVLIENEQKYIHVLFITQDQEQYAYDITSDILPRELYPDSLPPSLTVIDRNDEVLQNVSDMLRKKLKFHRKPFLFNPKRGYFLLPIDGKSTKVYQKDNFFGLPIV